MPATTCTELTAMWARDGGFQKCVGCHELKSVGIEEDGAWICEDCDDGGVCGCCDQRVENSGFGSSVNQGCCSDGACGHEPKIEVLCGDCGTWDEEDEVWRCPDCQEEHEAAAQPCETCKKPVWSNNDVYQKVHGCIVCQDCFDENEEAHEPPEPDGDGSGDDTTKCEVCGYVGDSVIVHDWGCVALCETCSNIDSEPHCPRTSRSGEAEQCEYCVAEWKERDEKDVNPPEPDGDGSGDE
jgi:hypothetical protein